MIYPLYSKGVQARKVCAMITRSGLAAGSILIGLLLTLGALDVNAVPYASNLTNADGIVSFRLNAGANRVWVSDGLWTNDLGPLDAGLHQVSMQVADVFQVTVFKADPIGYARFLGNNQIDPLQISSDTNVATRFFSPRGIAVNTDPSSPWFGRVYVANSDAGTVTNLVFGPERVTGDGLYALNSDLTDALGQGDSARTGGLDFVTTSDQTPGRLSLGKLGELYICDASAGSGGLYVVDADLLSGRIVLGGAVGGGFPVGPNGVHGRILAAVVTGSLASLEDDGLTAFVIDEDLQSQPESTQRFMLNSLWRHDIGPTIPGPLVAPTLVIQAPWFNLAGQIMDLNRGTNGYFYINDYRARGTDRAGLYVHDEAGSPLWNSLEASRTILGDLHASDLLAGSGAGAISDRHQLAAAMNQDTAIITVFPLNDGLPDLSRRISFQAFAQTNGTSGGLAFDAAGNLYVLSSTAQALRVFSPGGTTTAITGSDGSFTMLRRPQISVTAADFTVEGDDSSAFVIHRHEDTNEDVVVRFQFEGTAIVDEDYTQTNLDFTVTIPAGVTDVLVPFEPLADDAVESPESLVCSLTTSADYDLVFPISATCWILDRPDIRVSTVDSNAYERFAEERISFDLQREGETNSAVEVHYELAGTAVAGVDYELLDGAPLPDVWRFAPGETKLHVEFHPLDDAEFEGPESVVLRILPGARYRLGAAAEALAWITDDESPPSPAGSLLFSDDFDADTSSDWIVQFGANNGIYDAEVFWTYDYSQLGIPPAPHSKLGSTLGLFLQLDRTNDTPGGSSGINFYPMDRFFAGDYALRFDLFINAGSDVPTEHLLAGLNHSGLYTNRLTQSPDPQETTRGGDGVWFALGNDGAGDLPCAFYTVPAPGSFPELLTNRPTAALLEAFPSPPYNEAGAPGIGTFGLDTWTEVELSQIRDVITLKLNHQLITSFTNTTGFTNGSIMIGWNKQFDSDVVPDVNGGYAIFDNVEVISYAPAFLGLTLLENDQLALDFVAPGVEVLSELRLETSPELMPAVWQDSHAVIAPKPGGFRAIVPRTADSQYFRLVRH